MGLSNAILWMLVLPISAVPSRNEGQQEVESQAVVPQMGQLASMSGEEPNAGTGDHSNLQTPLGTVLSVDGQSSWIRPLRAALKPAPEVLPAKLMYVRVSRTFLDHYVNRAVSERQEVRDVILGTQLAGESVTEGETHLLLQPSETAIAGEIEFTGTVHARTVGHNGPAVFQYVSDTKFEARKPISISAAGLTSSPAEIVSAPTRLQTIDVDCNGPLLVKGVTKLVAARRDADAHSEAEAITGRHTAESICQGFDERTAASLAKADEAVRSNIAQAKITGLPTSTLRFRSTPHYVEMVLVRDDAHADEQEMLPAIEGNPDIAVRVHRALVCQALADPQVRHVLTTLAGSLASAPVTMAHSASFEKGSTGRARDWMVGSDWFALDLDHANEGPALAISTFYR